MVISPPGRPLLLFGGTGQVGRQLLQSLGEMGPVSAPTRAEANLADPSSVREYIRGLQPAVIVNAAALTNVDQAEREPGLARALNEDAPGIMAREAREIGALLVHYSTDYVFDGEASAPYDETAAPRPINVYGATKLAGERAVASAHGPHLIIRTSWVYSATGAGFVATLLRQLREQRTIRVVSDQVGSPTWSRSLAQATASIVRSLRRQHTFELSRPDWGVYHLGGSGAASRLEIAEEVIAASAGDGGRGLYELVPVSAAEFGAVAPRPRYSALANTRTARRFGVALDPWRSELRRMLGVLGN